MAFLQPVKFHYIHKVLKYIRLQIYIQSATEMKHLPIL